MSNIMITFVKNRRIMDTQYFPHFIRKNYPKIEGDNKDFIEIGEDFKKYLLETFKGKEDKLEKIWNISIIHLK